MTQKNHFLLKHTLIHTSFKRFRRNRWLTKPFKMIILKYLHGSDDKRKMNPNQWEKLRQIIFNLHICFNPSFFWRLSLHWKQHLKLVDAHTQLNKDGEHYRKKSTSMNKPRPPVQDTLFSEQSPPAVWEGRRVSPTAPPEHGTERALQKHSLHRVLELWRMQVSNAIVEAASTAFSRR